MMPALKMFWILYAKEVKQTFFSPLLYLLSGAFTFIVGWLFFNYLSAATDLSTTNVQNQVLIPFFGNMNFIFLFLSPLITMGLFSEELRNNTLELLMNSRATLNGVIMAKFAAGLTAAAFMLTLTAILPGMLMLAGLGNWAIIATSYAGLLCSLACYMAVGIFTSSLTENQMLAAIGSFSILLGLMLLVFSANVAGNAFLGQMFQYASIPFHFENAVRGVLKSYNFIYYFSFLAFFAVATRHSLELRYR